MVVAIDRWFVMALEEIPTEELLSLAPKSIELVRDVLAPKPATEEKS